MAVENVKYISDLDPQSPQGGDSISEGDDHLRNIKGAIKETFPYITGEVLLTSEELNSLKNLANGGGNSHQLAHAKWGADGMSYNVNVRSITETSKGNFTVMFDSVLPNYDYTIAITPAAVNGRPVISYVVSQAMLNPDGEYTPNGFEMQIREFDGDGNLILPDECGFTFLVVDNDPLGSNNP